MKAEHRHELKTNELADWIVHFPQWAKENLRMIIYVSVVVIVVVGAYFWKYYQKNIIAANERQRFTVLMNELARNKQQSVSLQAQGTDYSYTLIQTANKLRNFAQNTKNNNMAAMALIKSAEALRTEIHYRMGKVGTQDIKRQIDKAKTAYTQAVEKAQENPSLKAMAVYGQGLCEEELGNFEKAKQIYRQIEEDPAFEGTTARASAVHRLAVMDGYVKEVVFLERPKAPKLLPSSPEITLPEFESDILPTFPTEVLPNLPTGK
jgi:tetratricopeptide (TPR) repeat protein